MQTADRLSKIPPYLFVTLRNKINKARAEGVDVISLGVGDPVDPTPQSVIDELCRQAQDPDQPPVPDRRREGHARLSPGSGKLVSEKVWRRVEPGRGGGRAHRLQRGLPPLCSREWPIRATWCLMTSPGYPGYRASIYMGNAEPYEMPILDEGNYLPDFDQIPPEIVKRAKAMFLNYPNNPTGACATREFFGKVVEFAKAHDIAVCHDNPYSEVVFDGQERLSFLSVPGAKDVGIELNSLSKPYNMTGWRIGMAMGNRQIIAAICKVKENTDSGIFNADSVRGDRRPPERRRQHRQDDGHLLPPPEAGSGYL